MSVEKTINEYAKRARRIKQILYFETFPLNNKSDAERYVKLTIDYEFLTKMFSDMSILNWSDVDYEYKEK